MDQLGEWFTNIRMDLSWQARQSPCATDRSSSSSVPVARSSPFRWPVLTRVHTHLVRSQHASCPSLRRNLKETMLLPVVLEQVAVEVQVGPDRTKDSPISSIILRFFPSTFHRTFTAQFDISWCASTLPVAAAFHALVVSDSISATLSATSSSPCTRLLAGRSMICDHLSTLISIRMAVARVAVRALAPISFTFALLCPT